MKAQSVSAATDVTAENADPCVGLKGENAAESKKKTPARAIPTSGSSLAMVVSNCTIPAGRIPTALTTVSNQIAAIATIAASTGLPAMAGQKYPR